LLCADRVNFCIPIPKATLNALSTSLDEPRLRLLHGVPGYHQVAANFGSYLATTPPDLGSELTASHAMTTLMECVVFRPLDTYSSAKLDYALTHNMPEKRSSSVSDGLIPRCWPDMLVIVDGATMLIGEVRTHGNLQQAIQDIKGYVGKGGLSAQQYGQVPGILAYAAAGLVVQFLFITADGKVRLVRTVVAHYMCSWQQFGGTVFSNSATQISWWVLGWVAGWCASLCIQGGCMLVMWTLCICCTPCCMLQADDYKP
jgi:hypothetical protein